MAEPEGLGRISSIRQASTRRRGSLTPTVELPVRLTAPLDEARRVVLEAAAAAPEGESLAIYVQVGSLTEKTAWLNVVAYAPFGADVSQVASELRERAVSALSAAELLPA